MSDLKSHLRRLLCVVLRRVGYAYTLIDFEKLLVQRHGWRVVSGPFKGMAYVRNSCGSALWPKLLGTYELELHPVLLEILRTDYRTIIDVGCAEGYYAVGLARGKAASPDVAVLGFDTDPESIRHCSQLLALNDVGNTVRLSLGEFEPIHLSGDRILLVCDIEGAERILLDPIRYPDLNRCDILVEVHDEPGARECRDLLHHRFKGSHSIQEIPFRERSVGDLPKELGFAVSRRVARAILSEGRCRGLHWFFMKTLGTDSRETTAKGGGNEGFMSQFVYCLTSRGRDSFSAMTRISIASLRLFNPGAVVVLIVDSDSLQRLQEAGDPLLDCVDRIVPVQLGSAPDKVRSRMLKIQTRQLVQGRFVFLDGDTLVRGSLGLLFRIGEDVGAVVNHCAGVPMDQVGVGDRAVIEAMGWTWRFGQYCNSGVIAFNDTHGSAAIGSMWSRLWHEGIRETGVHVDQPAFNHALAESGALFSILSPGYNAQLTVRPLSVLGASVWHYYSSAPNQSKTDHGRLVASVVAGKDFELEDVRRLARAIHPWPDMPLLGPIPGIVHTLKDVPGSPELRLMAGDWKGYLCETLVD